MAGELKPKPYKEVVKKLLPFLVYLILKGDKFEH